MMDDTKPSDTQAKPPAPPTSEKKDEAAPKKAPYVFKIVPADPKNAFDFEDVADK